MSSQSYLVNKSNSTLNPYLKSSKNFKLNLSSHSSLMTVLGGPSLQVVLRRASLFLEKSRLSQMRLLVLLLLST